VLLQVRLLLESRRTLYTLEHPKLLMHVTAMGLQVALQPKLRLTPLACKRSLSQVDVLHMSLEVKVPSEAYSTQVA